MSGQCEEGDITPEEAQQICVCGHGRTDHDGTYNSRECHGVNYAGPYLDCTCPVFSERAREAAP